MDGTVAKLILDSLDNAENHDGTLGGVFKKYVESFKKVEEAPSNERDIILAKKLKELKSCELKCDLGWFDYDSWNTFPLSMQNFFIEKIDPLYYGGVFFQYSKLVAIEEEFWTQLPTSHSVTILNDCKNYHVHCVGPEDRRYDWVGVLALKALQKNFTKSTIMSIGTTSDGTVIKVDRRINDG